MVIERDPWKKSSTRVFTGKGCQALNVGTQHTESPRYYCHKVVRSSRRTDLRGSPWGVAGRGLHSRERKSRGTEVLCVLHLRTPGSVRVMHLHLPLIKFTYIVKLLGAKDNLWPTVRKNLRF